MQVQINVIDPFCISEGYATRRRRAAWNGYGTRSRYPATKAAGGARGHLGGERSTSSPGCSPITTRRKSKFGFGTDAKILNCYEFYFDPSNWLLSLLETILNHIIDSLLALHLYNITI